MNVEIKQETCDSEDTRCGFSNLKRTTFTRQMTYDELGWLGSWHIPALIVGNQDELLQQPWNKQREGMRSRNAQRMSQQSDFKIPPGNSCDSFGRFRSYFAFQSEIDGLRPVEASQTIGIV